MMSANDLRDLQRQAAEDERYRIVAYLRTVSAINLRDSKQEGRLAFRHALALVADILDGYANSIGTGAHLR